MKRGKAKQGEMTSVVVEKERNPWVIMSAICLVVNLIVIGAFVISVMGGDLYWAIGMGIGAYLVSVSLGLCLGNMVKRNKAIVERAIIRKWLAEIELIMKDGEEKNDEE